MKCLQPRGMNSPTTFFFLLDEATCSCRDPYMRSKKGWGVMVGQSRGNEAALSLVPLEQQLQISPRNTVGSEYFAMLLECFQGEKNEGLQTWTLMFLLGRLASCWSHPHDA